jgi:Zinc finger C-x8-C-x5-C-x3-H type (and similar)
VSRDGFVLSFQGACSKPNCPYLHVKLDTGARVCEAFLRGWCPAGAACREKHLTPEMVRQLRRTHVLRPGSQVKPVVLISLHQLML